MKEWIKCVIIAIGIDVLLLAVFGGLAFCMGSIRAVIIPLAVLALVTATTMLVKLMRK